jgi:hypothetical protein
MSRVTTKTKEGTAYPALPESRMGEDDFGSPASPTRSKAVRSKAPSSESPSQTKVQQSTAKSPSRKEPSNANRSVHGGADPEVGAASPPRNMASTWLCCTSVCTAQLIIFRPDALRLLRQWTISSEQTLLTLPTCSHNGRSVACSGPRPCSSARRPQPTVPRFPTFTSSLRCAFESTLRRAVGSTFAPHRAISSWKGRFRCTIVQSCQCGRAG